MRKLYLLIFILFGFQNFYAQGISFYEGNYQDAFEKASEEDRLVFVDAFAVWCGPCKRMAKQVFPKEEVGSFFNANFVNLKIDMEKGQGLDFRKTYPVSAFPTFFFIDGSGKVVHKYKGGRDVKGFLNEAKIALSKFDNTAKYVKLYDEGNRDYETVYKYIVSLNRAGKSSLKIANEYLKSQDNLSTDNNVRLIYESCTEVDSKVFDMLIGQKKKAQKIFGKEAFEAKIVAAASKTFEKSLDFESQSLEEQALDAVKKHAKSSSKAFAIECELEKARRKRDAKSYVSNANKYYKQVISNKEKQEIGLVTELLKMFDKDPSALNLASEIATNVASNNLNTSNCLLACHTFIKLQKYEEAKSWAQKAKEVAGGNKQDLHRANQQIKLLESR